MPDNNSKKPAKPLGLIRVSTGGEVNRQTVVDEKPPKHDLVPKLPPKKKTKPKDMTSSFDEFLSALNSSGITTIAEMREMTKEFENKTPEQLLQTPEGIAFLAVKHKFSFHPELPLEMNQFVARINLKPKTRPRLTGEEKKMTYNERYPHMQLPRRYIEEAEAIASRANVPSTMVIRCLLDTAFAGIGIKMSD